MFSKSTNKATSPFSDIRFSFPNKRDNGGCHMEMQYNYSPVASCHRPI
jgi:hypothetical protein